MQKEENENRHVKDSPMNLVPVFVIFSALLSPDFVDTSRFFLIYRPSVRDIKDLSVMPQPYLSLSPGKVCFEYVFV